MKENKSSYLFVLQQASAESAKNACALAHKLNIIVSGQTGNRAIELLVTPDEAERLFDQGLFSFYTRKNISPEHYKDLDPEIVGILKTWNARFSGSYLKLKKDKSKKGLKWQSEETIEPLPYSVVDPEMLFDELQLRFKEQYKSGFDEKELKPGIKIDTAKIGLKEVELAREFFHETLKDERLAEQVLGVFYRSSKQYRKFFLDPDLLKLIAEILRHLFLADEPDCLKMSGRNSIGIIFVESSRTNGPKFSSSDRATIENEIRSGLSFLAGEHPAGNLVWVYDVQRVSLDIADQANSSTTNDSYWRDPAIGAAVYEGHSFTDDNAGIDDFRNALRAHQGTQHATIIFISAFGMRWHAYSSGRRFIAMGPRGNNWGGWGIGTLNAITAHETCHQFGAADEYTGSGTPCNSCGGSYGCEEIPNGNCESCATPHEDCIMDANDLHLCEYTKGQVGWCDIFVELWTSNDFWSGTDDAVSLDIGYRTFNLDTSHDDRERGNHEGYALWAGGNLSRDSIKRILIRKSPDGFAGGWKLSRIKVYHDGDVICDRSPNVWLEDRKRWFLACSFDKLLVNKLKLTVKTADVLWAGTDDDVTLKLAGRSWDIDSDANDFERNSNRSYDLDPRTGLEISDIHTITIKKSPDGFAGGWKLKGLKLYVNNSVIYDNQSINKWLEDNDRTFSDSV